MTDDGEGSRVWFNPLGVESVDRVDVLPSFVLLVVGCEFTRVTHGGSPGTGLGEVWRSVGVPLPLVALCVALWLDRAFAIREGPPCFTFVGSVVFFLSSVTFMHLGRAL